MVLPYRRDMPARKRPTPEDTVTARRVLLDGLARDADIQEDHSTRRITLRFQAGQVLISSVGRKEARR